MVATNGGHQVSAVSSMRIAKTNQIIITSVAADDFAGD